MQKLTEAGDHLVKDLSGRYNLSYDAVLHMLQAVNQGGGSMAQFNCPELGGSGQWMSGGMTMVGDMFNSGLKNTVDNLCFELASILSNYQVFPPLPAGANNNNQWWPAQLGQPLSSGAQNNVRYCVFPNRLAVESQGELTIYDTLDHQISGVSQQQGNDSSVCFNSQWGNISVNSLPIISASVANNANTIEPNNFAQANQMPLQQPAQPTEQHTEQQQPQQINPITDSIGQQFSVDETLEIIAKLAHLKDSGALTEDEFNQKKTQLLQRI